MRLLLTLLLLLSMSTAHAAGTSDSEKIKKLEAQILQLKGEIAVTKRMSEDKIKTLKELIREMKAYTEYERSATGKPLSASKGVIHE